MTLLWLAAWLALGRSRPQMFGTTNWDLWGVTLILGVVFDTASLRGWWHDGHQAFVSRARLGEVLRFEQHFVEMGVAMVLGMFVMVWLAAWLGPPESRLLAMALFMAVPMVAWMRFRGHAWERSLEMAVAMFAPALLFVALHLAGVVSVGTMSELGHDSMWIAMLGLMLWRWPDYARHVHAQSPAFGTTGRRSAAKPRPSS